MSIETAKKHLEKYGFADKIIEFDVSSATVELAAEAVGCEPCMICKSLTFNVGSEAVMILAAGDAKVDNGVLADVAPSILHIMGLPQPAEMNGNCLIK